MNVTLLDAARKYDGVAERPGKETHPLIRWWLSLCDGMGDGEDDETAWCSAFVNGMCWEVGAERSHKANARSWLKVGTPVALDDAIPGWDVVVFWRGDLDGWQGHVALYAGRAQNGAVLVFGGNQGNRVCEAPYRADHVLGVRRIHEPNGSGGSR